MIASRRFRAVGTSCQVLAEEEVVDAAAAILRGQLAELDLACSRTRPDSELSRLPRGSGQPISQLLTDVLAAALRTAARTEGLVDLTAVQAPPDPGHADLGRVRVGVPVPVVGTPEPAAGYWRVALDQQHREVMVPRGVGVDVGASARAWAADRAAWTCATRLPGSFLVNLGGDIAVSGPSPAGGWRVAIDDSAPPVADDEAAAPAPVVTVRQGGLATSSCAGRAAGWLGTAGHPGVDPRTGDRAPAPWRAVTVVAATCELANAASRACLVLGEDGPQWLARRGLPARLVSVAGRHVYVGDWPADDLTALSRPA